MAQKGKTGICEKTGSWPLLGTGQHPELYRSRNENQQTLLWLGLVMCSWQGGLRQLRTHPAWKGPGKASWASWTLVTDTAVCTPDIPFLAFPSSVVWEAVFAQLWARDVAPWHLWGQLHISRSHELAGRVPSAPCPLPCSSFLDVEAVLQRSDQLETRMLSATHGEPCPRCVGYW